MHEQARQAPQALRRESRPAAAMLRPGLGAKIVRPSHSKALARWRRENRAQGAKSLASAQIGQFGLLARQIRGVENVLRHFYASGSTGSTAIQRAASPGRYGLQPAIPTPNAVPRHVSRETLHRQDRVSGYLRQKPFPHTPRARCSRCRYQSARRSPTMPHSMPRGVSRVSALLAREPQPVLRARSQHPVGLR